MTAVHFIDLHNEIHHDNRGMSFFPWQGRLQEPEDLLKTFHLVSIHPGHTRGNHLHPGHAEWLYPFHGDGILIWETDPGQVQKRLISGDSTLIIIPPGVPHALKNPGPEILYLLAWREEVTGAAATEPETVAHVVKSRLVAVFCHLFIRLYRLPKIFPDCCF
jgi:quercetin dioxygenase-like cupin family protein